MQNRLVAIATGLALLAVGFLAQRHEAEAAHVREHSGRVVHAQELADHHEPGTNAHLHGREVHSHAGDCTLLAVLHERVVQATTHVDVASIETTTVVEPVVIGHRVGLATYRFAPKTSPPVA